MKSDIDKIDEQIEAIQNAKKKPIKNVEKEETVIPTTDTKKLDKIEDVVEENVETVGDTKKMDTIEEVPKEVEEVQEESIVPTENEDTLSNQPKKKIPVIYIVLGVVIVTLIVVLVCLIIFKKNKTDTQIKPVSELTEKEKEQIIVNYGDAIQALVGYHKTKDDKLLTYEEADKMVTLDYKVSCRETEIHEDTSIYLNQCRIDNVSVKYSYGKSNAVEEEMIPEGTIRVYVTASGATLKKPKNGIKYEKYDVTIDEAYFGLKVLDPSSDYIRYNVRRPIPESGNNSYATVPCMINFKTGKKALENVEYTAIAPINIGGKYDPQYAVAKITSNANYYNGWKIYNLTTGQLALPEKYAIYSVTDELVLKNGLVEVMDTSYYENTAGMVDYKTGKVIIPTVYNICNALGKTMIVCYGSYDYFSRRTPHDFYDLSGNIKLAGMEVMQAPNDSYAFVKDGGKVKVMNFEGKVLYDYGKLNISDSSMYSSSYKDGYMIKYVNGERPYDYDHDLADSCVAIIYYPDTKKGEVKKTYCSKIDA